MGFCCQPRFDFWVKFNLNGHGGGSTARLTPSALKGQNNASGWEGRKRLLPFPNNPLTRNEALPRDQLAARIAGTIPLTNPTTIKITVATNTVLGEINKWISAASPFLAIALYKVMLPTTSETR